MTPHQLDHIKSWWTEIVKREQAGKCVDIISFAEAAHEYIPLLLTELERRIAIEKAAAASKRWSPRETAPRQPAVAAVLPLPPTTGVRSPVKHKPVPETQLPLF